MAGSYPLATLACTIDDTGISAPSYADILASLTASFQLIYGSDVYLGADSQDGQFLAIFAAAQNDDNAATIAAYNSFSPATAQGVGLSSVVKINGLARLSPSNSTADLTLTGTAGTQILAGVVADGFGNQWALPASVTIPGGGSVVATATCQALGAVSAQASTINKIANPQRGWQTATNVAAATPGAPVEDDATLRRRQSTSTADPAQTINAAILGDVTNIPGVIAAFLYENNTGSTDANGVPAHSICLVVEGGDAVAIATAIALRKTPGTGTYGTTTEVIIDSAGVTNTIHFLRPTIVRVIAEIDITALTGYVSTIGTQLVANAAAYASSLAIGGDVYLTKFEGAALLNGAALSSTYNLTNSKLARFGGGLTAADLVIAFNEIASLAVADITLNVV